METTLPKKADLLPDKRLHEAIVIPEWAGESFRHGSMLPAGLSIPMAHAAGVKRALRWIEHQHKFRVLQEMLEIAGSPFVNAPTVVIGEELAAVDFWNNVLAVVGDDAEEAGVKPIVTEALYFRLRVIRKSRPPGVDRFTINIAERFI